MLSYKKYIFLFLIAILAAPLASAQGNATGLLYQRLAEQVTRTYQAAILAQQQAMKGTVEVGIAAYKTTRPLRTTPQRLYPQASFLTRADQLRDYFLIRNNRKALSFLETSQQRFREIQEHLDELKRGRRSILEGEEINWVVSQIPDETSLLLLGERHYIDDIKLSMLQLLLALRKKYPHRPIVLFTEFLPDGFELGEMVIEEKMSKYTPIWLVAQNLGIPVVGLEPSFVKDNDKCEIVGETKEDIWSCYEGVWLRNKHYAGLINNFRQQKIQEHPEYADMLAVVYAGAGHTEYGRPNSLADMFPEDKIFSVSFYPTYVESENGDIDDITSIFDTYTNGLFAKDQALQYKSPKLARLMGSNIRLKVDPVHKIRWLMVGTENFSPEELQQILEAVEIQNLLNNP